MAKKYREAVCTALSFATWTRPDCAVATSKLARFLHNPGENHYTKAKHLLRYLNGTKAKVLTFDFSATRYISKTPIQAEGLVTYFDASHKDNTDNGRSSVGSITFLDGAVIDWQAKVHRRVTGSSNTSEYCAGAVAFKRAKAAHNILTALGMRLQHDPITMYCDNAGAWEMITNPGPRPKSRTMDVEEHILREAETTGVTITKTCPGKENPADQMTKILRSGDHQKYMDLYLAKSIIETAQTNPVGSSPTVSRASFLAKSTGTGFANSSLFLEPSTDYLGLLTRSYSNEDVLINLHKSLGHRNFEDVARLYGIPMPKKPIFCRDCIENKATRHPLTGASGNTLHAPRPGHTIDTDVAGPFPTKTKGGNSYLSMLIDRTTSKIDGSMITTPTMYFEHVSTFIKYCQTHFGKMNFVAVIHSDSASYYKDSARMRRFCARNGIKQTFSPAYTQSLNGRAERTIRTVIEMARTSLNASGLALFFYGEAIMYAIVVLNNIPKKGHTMTPEERWQGRKAPSRVMDKLAPFGCAAWVQDNSPFRGKFDKKATLHVFLNYDQTQHAYRIARLPDYKIFYSAHVHMNKSVFPAKDSKEHAFKPSVEVMPRHFSIEHMESEGSQVIQQSSDRVRTPSNQALRNMAHD